MNNSKSRREFEERLEHTGVDAQDYALQEDLRHTQFPGEDKGVYETSRVFEQQVIDTIKAEEKLGIDHRTGAMSLLRYEKETARLQAEVAAEGRHPHERRKTDGEKQKKEPFSIIALDLDHFKNINDTHGHPAGDAVLQEVVRRIKHRIRQGDFIARCGGEEFRIVILAANGSSPHVAEELRKIIEEEPVFYQDAVKGKMLQIPVRVSMGVTPYDKNTQIMEMRADQALYAAKQAGRNCVYVMNKNDELTAYCEPASGHAGQAAA